DRAGVSQVHEAPARATLKLRNAVRHPRRVKMLDTDNPCSDEGKIGVIAGYSLLKPQEIVIDGCPSQSGSVVPDMGVNRLRIPGMKIFVCEGATHLRREILHPLFANIHEHSSGVFDPSSEGNVRSPPE